ncbi:MAG: shikimate dehydrogenase [Alphaproteobacteria bacterium]|nr:shikimate dehydrogenase [Alphaproteobacteria bacterium]
MTAPRPEACVIGYPAKHSRSPKLHGYWLDQYGIDGAYRAEEISTEDFPAFVKSLSEHGYVGANVTMPHKEAALELSEPDERALAVGAANTLWLDAGRLKSTNTDVEGFLGSLDTASPGWDQRTNSALVLGAGGAGRAVIFGLIERGLTEIHVVNRTVAKAAALRERFGNAIEPAGLDALPSLMEGATLLVNTTSLGMHGEPSLDVDLTPMAARAVVADIVYVPLKTKLLRDAEAHGFATANGLDMLLHQAVRGFELWFGSRPEVTRELYEMLAADIEAGA